MKERPITFSTPMVQAIHKGHKIMTRRIIKSSGFNVQAFEYMAYEMYSNPKLATQFYFKEHNVPGYLGMKCPYGEPGGILYVRETWTDISGMGFMDQFSKEIKYEYKAKHDLDALSLAKDYGVIWKPSIHMPRTAARIFLEITDIRVERLQAMTRGDCMSEGCPFRNMAYGPDPMSWFADLWNSINGPSAWEANPWVWVISFNRIDHSQAT